ncbi:MAG: radical SAM protein [Nitrospirae bacterium]|nr:radical SAM protein [Nitrospirota bacterium]
MGDFSPFLIAWNLTRRCNLRCDHCYLSAGEREGGAGEPDTEASFRVIDDLASVNPEMMLVLTGGEPLLRKDLAEIAGYASRKGMMVVVGTNGTLLTDAKALELSECGVLGVSISLDSLQAGVHDGFRKRPGAWKGAVAGMEACAGQGLSFQVHATATRFNVHEIPAVMEFAWRKGARVFNLFFLICTGRGEMMSDITPAEYEDLLRFLLASREKFPGMLVRPRCAPHFKRIAHETDPALPITLAQGYEGGGCLAGTRYARITPEGDLTPCPYIPMSVGNVFRTPFGWLWSRSPVFEALRRPDLKGKCGRCEFRLLCGGCRARPWASHRDLMDEDAWCLYTPGDGPVVTPPPPATVEVSLNWSEEALQRLDRLPYFLRKMVMRRVEAYAAERGEIRITPELMAEVRRRTFGNETPSFRSGMTIGTFE